MASSFDFVEVDSTTLTLPVSTSNYIINAGSSQNVDVIDRSDVDGVRVVLVGQTGTSNITLRDNQSGTNIVLATGASNARIIGPSDRIELQRLPNGTWVEVSFTNV